MMNKLLKTRITLIALCFLFTGMAFGQAVNATYNGDGEYAFTSVLPSPFLHFYLYDNGHHSFANSNTHTYDLNNVPAQPKIYYAAPYGQQDPDEEEITVVDNGINSAPSPIYEMDNQVFLKRSWNMVDQHDNYFILMFENIDETQSVSGCVEFHFNSLDVDIFSNDILDDYGNLWVDGPASLQISDYTQEGYNYKYKWTFSNLGPLEQRMIYIPAWCKQPPLSKIKTMAVMRTDDCVGHLPYDGKDDGGGSQGGDKPFYTLKSKVSNYPHDPNCIVTETTCLNELDVSQKVKYRVYFQNEGQTVEDVVVYLRNNEIPFDKSLFSYDVTLVEASHACHMVLDPSGASYVRFEDIYLPGLEDDNPPPLNYDKTIGWVDLEWCYNLGDLDNYNLDNLEFNVGIEFDLLTPIEASNVLYRRGNNCLTQLAFGEVCQPFANLYQEYDPGNVYSQLPQNQTNILTGDLDFELVPNPSADYVNINLTSGSLDEDYEISIFDINNKLIKEFKYADLQDQRMDVTDLQSNVYLIMVKGSDTYKVKRFIKI